MWLWFKSNLTGCHALKIETSHLDSRQTLNSRWRLSVCCYLAGSHYRCGQVCWCGTDKTWMEECMKKAGMWKSQGVSHGTSHEPILSENFLLNEKHEDRIRRWAARMGVQREHGWRYFTSITVQFILLKLFFRETQKDVYYRWDCLQRFTSHRICSYTKTQNCLKKPQYGQMWPSAGVTTAISLTFGLLKIYFWTPNHIPYFFLALFYISFTRHHPGRDASIKKDKLQTQY